VRSMNDTCTDISTLGRQYVTIISIIRAALCIFESGNLILVDRGGLRIFNYGGKSLLATERLQI